MSDQPTTALTTEQLLERLLEVRRAAVDLEERRVADLDAIPVDRRSSGANLLHYVAVRNVDLRVEQQALSLLGLSSLGRAEGHVLATLDAVLRRLAADVGRDLTGEVPDLGLRGPDGDQDILETQADEALGAIPAGRPTRIMVTLPSEAAGDPELVDRFVSSGMTVARVNCAHDGPAAWARMVANVRDASIRHRRAVRVSFDLAGPKLRTGDLEPGPAVLRLRPQRDELGRVVTPASVRLVAGRPADLSGEVPEISVDEAVVCSAEPGDEIRLRDARGRKRRLTVTCAIGSAVDATTDRTVYLVPGLKMDLRRGHTTVVDGQVGPLPPTAASIELVTGDTLELRRGDGLGRAATTDGERARPAFVYVDLADVFDSVLVGERVLIDDGKIEATVTAVGPELISLVIERPARSTLRPEKGINLPDTRLHIPALTADDVAALDTVAPIADLVSVSFVGEPDDVDRIHDELVRLGCGDVGIVLKIEHRRAFEALPMILLRALRHPSVAVMIARGDLAVEVGYERLAEVQEEILLLCEAAHVPVIWATQVLETLAKRGAPTRAEITDAASASRAECVMLNKGPFVPETIEVLDDIVARMRGHLAKRTPTLRRLAVAGPLARRPADAAHADA